MRKAGIYNKDVLAGILIEENSENGRGYVFRYEDEYFHDQTKHAISLTLPKSQQEFRSEKIFPFFSNMIAEGFNLNVQSRYNKVDANDVMGLLLASGTSDTIGSVTVAEINDK